MRLLVLSDLHANLTALEAALSAAKESWDRVVCLGDVVGYGPDPNEVTSQIREMGAVTIRGNHDKAVADLMVTDDFNPIARVAVQWTRAQLSNENMDWLASLRQGPIEAEGVVLVHGAFQDEDEYVFTPSQAPGFHSSRDLLWSHASSRRVFVSGHAVGSFAAAPA